MRIIVEGKELQAALALCAGVTRGGTIPILQNVLLAADGGLLRLTATNLDFQIAASAGARVEIAGEITAPLAMLGDLVKAFPAGAEVLLDDVATPNRLFVQCGSAEYRLPTLPAADFPILRAEGLELGGDILCDVLQRLLAKAAPHAGEDKGRYFINCSHLRASPAGDGLLRIDATDGKRAAAIDGLPGDGFKPPKSTSIPNKTVDGLLRLLGASKGLCSLRIGEKMIALEASSGELVSRLMDSQFPPIDRVWPQDLTVTVSADRELLANVIRRISLLADAKDNPIKLQIGEGELTVGVRSEQLAEGRECIPVTVDGGPFEVNLGARNFQAVLQHLEGRTVTMRFGGPKSPFVITSDDDQAAQFLVMPHAR